MSNQVRIENWSVVMHRGRARLSGHIYNHPDPRHEDGKAVNTSPIVSADGNQVLCESRAYELGAVDPDFRIKCQENGVELDAQDPAPAVAAMARLLSN